MSGDPWTWTDTFSRTDRPRRERTGANACRMELCEYWPGEGCMRGVLPCDDSDEDDCRRVRLKSADESEDVW